MRVRTLLLTIISFVVFSQLINYFVIHSFNILELEGRFPPTTKIYLESSNGLHNISAYKHIRSGVADTEEVQNVKFHLNNRSIRRFRLRFEEYNKGLTNNHITIESISLSSNFSKTPIKWSKQNINDAFTTSNNPNNKIKTVTSNRLSSSSTVFLSWVLPFFLSLCITLLITKFEWRRFPAIQDLLNNQHTRTAENYAALDGFRGLAALLVLLEHSVGMFKFTGALGVWMFFVLSGFLLTKPFVVRPTSSIQTAYLSDFMVRRFKRIIPMYFFMVTFLFLLRGNYELALRHYLFVQGDGHYWTILQEIYFYLLLPILTLAVYALCRGRAWFAVFILLISAILWEQFGSRDVFSMYVSHRQSRAYFEVFIAGMLGAYLYHGIYQQNSNLKDFFNKLHPSFGLVSIILLCGLIYVNSSSNTLFGMPFKVHKYPLISGLICLLLILLAIIGKPNCWYKRILTNSVLRYTGIIGYSFYLLHPYCISIVKTGFEHFFAVNPKTISELGYLMMVTTLTLLFASFTYSFIERPFLKRT